MRLEDNSLYEKLITFFSSGDYATEIEHGRAEFEALVSPLRAEDPAEGFILSCFHSWYLFQRKIKKHIKTPGEIVLEKNTVEITGEERVLLDQWVHSIHSIFLITRVGDHDMDLKDFLGTESYAAEIGPYARMLRKGELLEARIFFSSDEKKTWFHKKKCQILPGICVHPLEARKYIERRAKQLHKQSDEDRKEFFFDLQKRKLKSVRYSNIKPENIYDERLPF